MTPKRLRELYGEPSPRAAAKVTSKFDKHCRRFIENATFLVLATSDGENLDVSPKGDPAGFVAVESESTLLVPDRPGNNRVDGLMNILRHPKVALVFIIPTVGETLRVNGTAEISDDPALCARFQVRGRSPKTVLRITAEEVFLHCGKAPMRAGLWRPETWPRARPVASLNEIVRDHSGVPVDSLEQAAVEEKDRKALY
ncbi:pyridoxamine 5'-phosphate oxidase family protein [Afifella pfennigii]|uniref:pyridoxamine 5'-phosphate oxidase family protein n=1 Tax=Afifella pfennigii TaxID=209897 RepID=UPI00047E133E|nr:pyridoxamine 5'-phosphate oxidase family protein [Afifella pfennigii]